MKRPIFFLLAFSMLALSATAEIKLPNVLTSNMILQRDQPVAIWGTTEPNQKVEVRFAGQVKTTQASATGKWILNLDPMPASFESRNLELSSAGKDTVLTNVLVGEVWLCGGQSNMEYPMDIRLKKYTRPFRGDDLAAREIRQGGSPNIRLMLVEKVKSLPDCTTKGWQECSDSTMASFSAVAYFFGKNLQETLKVPVGLIASSWGGTRIEPWTPESAYEQSPAFSAEAAQKPCQIDNSSVGLLYNSMIAPLAPYTLKGFIWYQGESNAMNHETRYVEKTKLMLDAWRSIFQQPAAPFYYVQIAPYYYTQRKKDKLKHTVKLLAEFGEMQTRCLELPYTGQVVVTDLVDDLSNIHPSYKWEVGRRLSLIALAKTYNKDQLVYSGPMFQSAQAKKNKLILTFSHVGSGLTAGVHDQRSNDFQTVSNEELSWFEVAAANDTVFHPAKAVIQGNTVVLTCPEVKKPKQIHFAWNEAAMPNFFNREGLPAVPFRIKLK
jgi:sialate O-acetylesterase